jgi:hypothetical protein
MKEGEKGACNTHVNHKNKKPEGKENTWKT